MSSLQAKETVYQKGDMASGIIAGCFRKKKKIRRSLRKWMERSKNQLYSCQQLVAGCSCQSFKRWPDCLLFFPRETVWVHFGFYTSQFWTILPDSCCFSFCPVPFIHHTSCAWTKCQPVFQWKKAFQIKSLIFLLLVINY